MNDASNILKAVRVLRTVTSEVEALMAEVENALINQRQSSGFVFNSSKSAALRESYYLQGGWLMDGFRWTYVVRKKGNGRGRGERIGELSFAVDLGRAGWLAERMGFPCLMVTWSHIEDSWLDNLDQSSLLPLEERSYTLLEGALLIWTGEEEKLPVESFLIGPSEYTWMFAMPLLSISNRRAVLDLLINPIVSMLSGDVDGLVFGEGHPAVRFDWKDDQAVARTTSQSE